MDDREAFVKSIIKDKNSRILEIGPLNRPITTKSEFPNCFYCDIRSTEEIKALYTGNNYLETTGITIDVNTIIDIDYVLKENYQKTFGEEDKFDYVIASHVLEHIEDIIDFFNDITSVLKIGGKLCVVYPDKRYCFDHFRESASFRDAYDVYKRGYAETARMILDFLSTSIDENAEVVYWSANNLQSLLPKNDIAHSICMYQKTLNGEKMDDVHFWPFTDYTFLKFLYDCVRADLISFTCIKFFPTKENSQQFMLELEYTPDIYKNRDAELQNLTNLIATVPVDYHNSKHIRMEKDCNELTVKTCELEAQIVDLQNTNNKLVQENNTLDVKCKVLDAQNSELIKSVNSLTTHNAMLANSIDTLTDNNNKLLQSEKQLLEQKDRLIVEKDQLNETKQKLLMEKAQLENIKEELSQNIEVLKIEKIDIMKQLTEKSILLTGTLATLKNIEESTSWKMTKPIRFIIDVFKNLFH